MKMKRGSFVAVLLILAIISGIGLLAGCSKESAVEAEAAPAATTEAKTGIDRSDFRVGISIITFAVDYFKEVAYGAIMAGEDYGCQVLIYTAPLHSPADQVNLIENIMQTDVDAISLTPIDAVGLQSIVESARKKGITIVSEAHLEGGDMDASSVICTDDIEMGMDTANLVVRELGGSGNVVVLQHEPGIVNGQRKMQGLMSVFDNTPGIKVVAAQSVTGGSQENAQSLMADILQANKKVDAVVGLNETYVLGAINSIEEAGLKPGQDIKLYSMNYGTTISDQIRSGKISSAIYSWGTLFGYWAVQMAIREQEGLPVPPEIRQPTSFVTKDNVDKFNSIAITAKEFDFNKYMSEHK